MEQFYSTNSPNFCQSCGSSEHDTSSCPFQSIEKKTLMKIEHQLTQSKQTTDTDENFVPLRKKVKRASTGQEDNLVESYYHESYETLSRTQNEVEQIRWNAGIEVEGESVPKPILKFSEIGGLSHELLSKLYSFGYHQPTPIQQQCIPCILNGRDVIGHAQTGSGKTLAYVLPLLIHLNDFPPNEPGAGPRALILGPTRELVEQIYSEIDKFLTFNPERLKHAQMSWNEQENDNQYPHTSHLHNIPPEPQYNNIGHKRIRHRALDVCGGISMTSQMHAILNVGVDVIVATPGRLLDLLQRGVVQTDRLTYLVLDEVDRMLSMNMEDQLRKIVAFCSSNSNSTQGRQTVLLSATMPTGLERLARSAVMNPIKVMVGQTGALSDTVEHNVIFVHSYHKKQKLLEVLRRIPEPPVIIFCNNHHTVDKVVGLLKDEQFHVAGIHGNKSQDYRFRVMKAFKDGQLDVLVASDLVSRGIDVIEVQHVIMYDLPDTIEDYVHRSGRTGRMGRVGVCTSLLAYECKIAKQLKQLLKDGNHPIPKELEESRLFGGEVLKTEYGDIPAKMKMQSFQEQS